MLKLVRIKKDYPVAGNTVHALRDVSLEFRRNEFVSILGPSGCGKTTLLNIIGGLDKYTSGDLVIAGKSTQSYKDADWDAYRNHRIGFIFQSYNLIPHQTILGNVELALTIGGMSAKQRRQKAISALKRVGLGAQINKHPNQLSGGQMQRVAIARALVNDPEILLADEPTGALDTTTSIQIMELIKEIAKERLVIMVTHNPELAEQYSSRIVRLLDGRVIEDTNPYNAKKENRRLTQQLIGQGYTREQARQYIAKTQNPKKRDNKEGKTNMSFATSLALSARNLWSKKGRTAVTAFAGSIGIIGVCLVLALSAGIRGYISDMQDDMLSGNPVSIQETGYNVDALTDAMNKAQKQEVIKNPEKGKVYIDSYVEALAELGSEMANMLVNNNISAEYVDYVTSMPKDYYAAMTVGYGIDVSHSIYTDFTYVDENGAKAIKNMSIAGIQTLYTQVLGSIEDYKSLTDYISMYTNIFAQAPNSADYISSQYEVSGKIATEKDEIMIVVDKYSQTTDLTMAQLGYLTQDEFMNYAYKATEDSKYDESLDVKEFTDAQILGKNFKWYPNDSLYTANVPSASNMCGYMYSPYGDGLSDEGALELKIVGILKPKENISYGCLRSGIYYTQELAEYAIEQNKDSKIVEYANSDTYKENGIYSGYYTTVIPGTEMTTSVATGVGYTYEYVFDGVKHENVMGFVGLNSSYGMLMNMMGNFGMGGSSMGGAGDMKVFTARNLGGESVANSIYLYPVNFESKDLVTDYLDKWNEEGDIAYFSNAQNKEVTVLQSAREQVTYTDSLELIISMLNSMIDIITYGLVAFTSISLVVSSVMIGVITYVSVVERTKEIGVLRSLGARKKDISNLFNAETFIIGLLAGVLGVGVTYLISIPVNMILGSLTGIYTIASLPWWQGLIMICISFVLTMISGLFPASAAAKKDPVIALRTE